MDESKHGEVRYWSASRHEFVVIDGMPTRHLSNAAKKLANNMTVEGFSDEFDSTRGMVHEVLCAMIDELASRVPAAGEGA